MMRVLRKTVFASLLALVASMSLACAGGTEGEWLRVSQGDLSIGIEIDGELKAANSFSVGPPNIPEMWEYKIAELAEDGQEVKIGDPLVSFDPTLLRESLISEQSRRDSARATLAKRKSEIRLLERDLELGLEEARANVRKSELSANDSPELSAHLTLQTAKLDYEAAKANAEHLDAQLIRKKRHHQEELASLQGSLELAESRYNRFLEAMGQLQVKADREGTVILASNWSGEKRKVGDQVWRAEPILEIASLDSMEAIGNVDEADYAKLKVGQMTKLRLEAHPDKELDAELLEIGRSVQFKSFDIPSKVVKVELDLKAPDDLPLRPQMRFRGKVETEVLRNVLVVPEEAIFPSPEGPVVYRRRGDDEARVAVKLGKRGTRGVEVLSGLAAGDEVSLTAIEELD